MAAYGAATAAQGSLGATEGCNCSMTSTTEQQQCSGDCDASLRTHHLLKHCLTQSQRVTALSRFHTDDPKEAARDIARFGQRELQAKFKEIYGSATKSNNNSWLRRKLYEAVGVAPLKVATKGKGRKGAGSGSSGGSRKQGHATKDSGAAARSRPSKLAAVKAPRRGGSEAACPSPRSHRGGRLPLSGGPLSILDLHHHSSLSNDTSDSEDADSHCQASNPAALPRSSAPGSPTSPLAFPGSAVFSLQQQATGGACLPEQCAYPLPPAPAGFVPVPLVAVEPQSPMAGLHWADGFSAAAMQQAAASCMAQASGPAAAFLPVPPVPMPAAQPVPPVEADLSAFSSAFKPMELEQEPGSLWDAGAEAQPWYYGASLDLAALTLPKSLPLGCTDDDVPLLTLDLGAIDVSV